MAEATTEAEVVVGNVSIEDELGEYLPIAESNIFTDYVITNRFEKDYHRYMMGITSPNGFQGNRAAFVQLASPTLLWIADWTVARYNEQPPIPDPESADPNWILLDEHPELFLLTVSPDGATPRYRISGTYVYGHTNPSVQTVNDVNFPRPPFLADSFDRTMPTNYLEQNLIDLRSGRVDRTAPGVPASQGYSIETIGG